MKKAMVILGLGMMLYFLFAAEAKGNSTGTNATEVRRMNAPPVSR